MPRPPRTDRWANMVRTYRKSLADDLANLVNESEYGLSESMTVKDLVAWLRNPEAPV